MPRIEDTPKQTTSRAAKPKPASRPVEKEAPEREVKYEQVFVNGVAIPEDALIVDIPLIKKLLGHETQAEYAERLLSANPKLSEEEVRLVVVRDGKEEAAIDPATGLPLPVLRTQSGAFHKDQNDMYCVLHNNVKNRPFDPNVMGEIRQALLHGQYRFNGESMVVGKTGITLSLQHRGVAMLEAQQILDGPQGSHWRGTDRKPGPWYGKDITLRSIIVYGVGEDQGTVMTLDTGRERRTSDTIFTSDVFADLPFRLREDCSETLAKALEFVWDRTSESEINRWVKHRTQAESMAFYDRHKRLKQCVRSIIDINGKDRKLGLAKLQVGRCAGWLYLMAASESVFDQYRNSADGIPRESVKGFAWTRWKEALDFWTQIGKGSVAVGAPVIKALALLKDVDTGTGGRTTEKDAVICRAWRAYLEQGKFQAEDVCLGDDDYEKDANGQPQLKNGPHFSVGGIDAGPKVAKPKRKKAAESTNGDGAVDTNGEAEPTEEEVAERKEVEGVGAIRKQNGAKLEETPEEERARREAIENGQSGSADFVKARSLAKKLQAEKDRTEKDKKGKSRKKKKADDEPEVLPQAQAAPAPAPAPEPADESAPRRYKGGVTGPVKGRYTGKCND